MIRAPFVEDGMQRLEETETYRRREAVLRARFLRTVDRLAQKKGRLKRLCIYYRAEIRVRRMLRRYAPPYALY